MLVLMFSLVMTLAQAKSSARSDCVSDMGKTCIPKNQLGGFSSFVNGGDPCFVYKGKRMCFVTLGQLHPCTCTEECGCGDVVPVAACPVDPPQTPDCSSDKEKYCSLGADNTMCKYCGVDINACYGSFCKNDLSDDDKTTLVKKHNDLRAQLANGNEAGQPSAANMKKLKWSDELAKIAQRWADQCPQGHDHNRGSPDFPKEPGQNKADAWSSGNNFDWELEKKVQAWYDEVKDWPASNVGAFSSNGASGTIGHYTQVVWADTEYVGCGVIYYKDGSDFAANYPYRKTLVCNYYPPGNYRGQPVYQIGAAGSSCPNGSENGLCL